MKEKELEKLISASEQVDSILLLSNLAESAIETDTIEKAWDLHLLFGMIKKLSKDASDKLLDIQESIALAEAELPSGFSFTED